MTATGLEPIDRTTRPTLTTELGRRLLAYLMSGAVKPGDRIPSERQLAEQLGVGRSVVREALKSLTLLGLLEVRQGDGTFLRAGTSNLLPQAIEWGLMLGEKRTLDLVEARLYLEPVLAGLAAERRDDSALEDLRRHLATMAQPDIDAKGFVAADVAFHIGVAQAAQNTALSDMLTSVRSLLQVWIARVIDSAPTFGPSYREHVPVLEAIERADPDGARDAMREHMVAANGRLIATLSSDPDRDGAASGAPEATSGSG